MTRTKSLLCPALLLLGAQLAMGQILNPNLFTYQGRLDTGGAPAEGVYDFYSLLYTNATSGSPLVGPPMLNPAVIVSNGLFTMVMNASYPGAFNGQALWLELQVRTNGSGSYTTLAPRQRLTPTPYATYSVTSGSVSNYTGAIADSQLSANIPRVNGPASFNVDVIAVGFVGDGSFLTGLDASQLSQGTVPDLRIGANFARRDTNNTFSASNVFAGVIKGSNPSNQFNGAFTGSFTGNGAGLSNLPAATLPGNPAYLNSNQTFTASNVLTGVVSAPNSSNQFAGSFTGNGAGLTLLNPVNLSAGTAAINVSGNAATATTATSATTAISANSFSGPLTGDVTGTQAATTVARIRGVNVASTAPGTNQLLRFDGSNWTPSGVALGTDASGILPIPNGGTGAGTASNALVNLGGASLIASNTFSGVNKITNAANVFSGDGFGLLNLNLAGTVNNTALQNNAITAPKIASGQVVKSLNGLTDAVTLAAGANVTLGTNLNSLVISAAAAGGAASNAWNLLGNVGTSSGVNFLGTTDNQPMEFRVFNNRALRLENAGGLPNVVGGHSANLVSNGVSAATIAGGGGVFPNRITAFGGVVGGGDGNIAGNETADPNDGAYAAVGGGHANKAGASQSVVAGGVNNTNSGVSAVIGGGSFNRATGVWATVSGGAQNLAGGWWSSVPGGSLNEARGDYSFAAGRQAKAANPGTFVWADSIGGDFISSSSNQFLIRASGGVGIGTANPQARLEIDQNYSGGSAGMLHLESSGTEAGLSLEKTNNGTQRYSVKVVDSANGFGIRDETAGGALRLQILNTNGFVGINTNNPQAQLHVRGTVMADLFRGSFLGDGSSLSNVTINLSNVVKTIDLQDNSVTAAKIASSNVVKSLNGLKDNLNLIGGANVTVTTSNGTDIIISAAGGGSGGTNAWLLGGNAGTTSANFLGTTDNQALQLRSFNYRGLELTSATRTGVGYGYSRGMNLAAGYFGNFISSDVIGATIAGGGFETHGQLITDPIVHHPNGVTADFGTVGGGGDNAAGNYGTVPGGSGNSAAGQYSFAAGRFAQANDAGSFVWADSQNAGFASTASDQFSIRAQGGVRLDNSSSMYFGNQRRQMLNLYADTGYQYGIGVQAGTLYQRSEGDFAWYAKGTHADGHGDAGGGTELMRVNDSKLSVRGQVVAKGNAGDELAKFGYSSRYTDGTFFNWYGVTASCRRLLGAEDEHCGFGEAIGPNIASPVIWMNDYVGNAFEVKKVGSGQVVPTGTKLFAVHSDGVTEVNVLQINGGSDLAEPFHMSDQDIPKGSLVVIDDENPGKLKLSTQACDSRVAGIISGANGINPGITLHQEGVFEGGQNVALSGRVYALADATSGPIQPGDLLTSSSTPGHVMKVTDHAHAQGAIVGKAMSALKEGKGMVLVLVSLQ